MKQEFTIKIDTYNCNDVLQTIISNLMQDIVNETYSHIATNIDYDDENIILTGSYETNARISRYEPSDRLSPPETSIQTEQTLISEKTFKKLLDKAIQSNAEAIIQAICENYKINIKNDDLLEI